MSKDLRSGSFFLNGVLISLAGAVCFSTKAVLVKLAYRDTAVDAVTLLALRMVFSLPFFVVLAWRSSNQTSNVKFTPAQWVRVAVIGCLGYYISSLLDFLGLQYVTAGIERLILFVYPTLVLLISSFFFKEKITRIQWAAVAITYAGLLIAFLSEVEFGTPQKQNFLFGSLLILVCAFTYAAYIAGSGRLIPIVGAAKFNSYAMTCASAGVLIHFAVVQGTSLMHLQPAVYGYSAGMAILSTVIPSFLVAEGIRRIGADNTAITGSIGPVSTIIMAWFFLGESVSIFQWVGTVLILAGVFLIGKQKQAPDPVRHHDDGH